MSEKNDPVTFLPGLAAGRWQGEEEMVVDSSTEPMAFTSTMQNDAALGGAGISIRYSRSRDGETTMHSHTVIRLSADSEAVMTWVPAEGEPQIFCGRVNGPVLEVSRSDEDGMRHTITEDFGDGKTMTNVMTVTPPGGEPMTVFTGAYRKLGPVAGRELWRDLTLPDAAGARPFYQAVLGWKPQPVDMGGYDDYNMLDAEGEVAGGVCHARGSNAVLADPAGAQIIACEQNP